MGGKNIFPHPKEFLIWPYPENLFKIHRMVAAHHGRGQKGTGCYSIDNLSLSFWLWLVWLALALAWTEVCKKINSLINNEFILLFGGKI